MKKKIYVFKTEYRSTFLEPGVQGSNHLVLVATFEANAEKDAIRFASNSAGGPFCIWVNGGENVEEGK